MPVAVLYGVYLILTTIWLTWWLSGKKSDPGSIPGSGRSPGKGNGFPFQYSCLGNPMDRGAWRATVHGVTRARHYLATKPPPVFHLKLLVTTFQTWNTWLYRKVPPGSESNRYQEPTHLPMQEVLETHVQS